MNCPKCLVSLSMSDRQGVEIDFCPQCRGVWLDRGELDKIIERSSAAPVAVAQPQAAESYPAPSASAPPRERRREYDDDDDDSSYRTRDGYAGHGKKKKSFLGDLFDF
jgi:Zn-finger nucleic acid-binding protein